MKGLEYRGLTKVDGPIIILDRTEDVGLGELVAVYDRDRGERAGRIIELSERAVAVQIFGGDPEKMALAAQVVERLGADAVACPPAEPARRR